MTGHYWCDNCNETAGPVCRGCQRETRFVPAPGTGETKPAARSQATKPPVKTLSLDHGRQLFAAIRQNLSCL